MSEKTVVVGMSGGVDSSLTALLLKQQGYRVIGMFMKNWDELSDDGQCPAAMDFEDVVRVCDQIGIPYYSVNFAKNYWEEVFVNFLEELKAGRTPNPDILCNREIKFKVLLEKAIELGGDSLATGHYCQTQDGLLLKGADLGKDQSYFLYTLKSEILSKVLFPIGALPKQEVRRLAKENHLANSEKKDSTGICFIGERNFRNFLSQYIAYQPGNFENLEGKVIGSHHGVAYYTIGQRKGMGIGGPGEAWFVVDKDPVRNVVIITQGSRHPALFCQELTAHQLTWVGGAPAAPFKCYAKIRYRQPDQECEIKSISDGKLHVQFAVPQRAATPGQSIVFYDGPICLGGGIILDRGPSYHKMGLPLPEAVSP